MRLLCLCFGAVTLVLQAQGKLVISGCSTLRNGKVESSTIGSILEKDLPAEGFDGGLAILEVVGKPTQQVLCEVQSLPGEDKKTEIVNWRVGLPDPGTIKSLKVLRGSLVVATLATPKDLAPPTLQFVETRNGEDVSIVWVLNRPAKYEKSSLWMRCSKDQGKTWLPGAKLLSVDEGGTGQLDLDAATWGNLQGMIVEFWVPQDLQVTRVRHVIGAKP